MMKIVLEVGWKLVNFGLAIRRGLAEYVRMSWSQPAAPLPPPIPPPLALPGVWPPLPAPAAHAAVAASLFG